MTQGVRNYSRDVPSKNRRQSSTYLNNIMPIITKKTIFELQGFLKHNDFFGKSVNKFFLKMLEDLTITN
jgi:hypothetical protein